jgi:hypothetical protein
MPSLNKGSMGILLEESIDIHTEKHSSGAGTFLSMLNVRSLFYYRRVVSTYPPGS